MISTLYRQAGERSFDSLLSAHLFNLIGSVGLTETGYVAHLVEASAIHAGPPPKDALPPEEIEARYERAMAILREIHPHITDEDRAFDYDAWLYDENGAPR